MEHVVFSAAVDGAGEEFRRVSSLEEAVRVVEHLRNDLGIEDASVFSLTPVPLAFRTYYRVEVPGVESVAEEAPAAPLASVPPLISDGAPLLPIGLAGDAPAPEDDSDFSLVPSLEPTASLMAVPSVPEESSDSLESMAELADMVAAAEESSELPSMPGLGLQPRDGESESEHSLGYFSR